MYSVRLDRRSFFHGNEMYYLTFDVSAAMLADIKVTCLLSTVFFSFYFVLNV